MKWGGGGGDFSQPVGQPCSLGYDNQSVKEIIKSTRTGDYIAVWKCELAYTAIFLKHQE